MAEEGQPGASAGQRAAELREQAARLEAEAANWDRGSEGERLTRELLAPLIKDGFQLLDDLAIPGSKANVDHVVIVPSGVFVIDTKNYSGQLSIGNNMVWRGRYPLRRELDTLRWETQQVQLAFSRALPAWIVAFRSVLCVHGGLPAGTRAAVAGVDVVSPDMLTGLISEGPSLLTQSHMLAAAIALKTETTSPRCGDGPVRSRPACTGSGVSAPTTSNVIPRPPQLSVGTFAGPGKWPSPIELLVPQQGDAVGRATQGPDRPRGHRRIPHRRQGHLCFGDQHRGEGRRTGVLPRRSSRVDHVDATTAPTRPHVHLPRAR